MLVCQTCGRKNKKNNNICKYCKKEISHNVDKKNMQWNRSTPHNSIYDFIEDEGFNSKCSIKDMCNCHISNKLVFKILKYLIIAIIIVIVTMLLFKKFM